MNLDTITADTMLDAYLRGTTARRTWWDEVKTTDHNSMEFKSAVANWYNKRDKYLYYDDANTWFDVGAYIKDATDDNSLPRPIGFEEEHPSDEPSQELEDFLSGFSVHTTGGDE